MTCWFAQRLTNIFSRPLRISPALLRQASYGTIKIGTYNTLKRMFVAHPEGGCHCVSLTVLYLLNLTLNTLI